MSDEITKYSGRNQTLAANADSITEIVSRVAEDVERLNRGEKVNLTDIDRIRSIEIQYLRECADGGFLPSVTGIASHMGMTRQNLYAYAKSHPDSEFDTWLQSFSDICGEVMMEAAMRGSIKEVSAIFTAKSRYLWRDNVTLEVVQPEKNLLKYNLPDEIAAKYADLPED